MIQPTGKSSAVNPFTNKASTKTPSNLLDTLVNKPSASALNKPAKTESNENEPDNLAHRQQENKQPVRSLITRNSILLKGSPSIYQDSESRKKAERSGTDGPSAQSNQKEAEPESLETDSLVVTMIKPRDKISNMNQRAELISPALGCLQLMYKTIKNNSQSIKIQIYSKLQANRVTDIQLTSEQQARLMQGLYFYKPLHNKGITLLQQCFEKHPLAQQLQQVSTTLGLDYLKSYYLIKEVYSQNQNYQPQGFTFMPEKSQLISTSEVVKLASQFLIVDKKNLLECYFMMLGFSCRPSMKKICLAREQLDLLWGCISSMETEPIEIQEMVFSLYLKYSNFVESQQPTFLQKQLLEMKKKMSKMNLHPSIRSQLQQMSIDEMLEQGSFKVEECSEHYQDLVQFIVQRREIDFEQAITRLPASEKLSHKWMNYLKESITQVSFTQDRRLNVLKAIYIYKIMGQLSSASEALPKFVEINLLRAIVQLSVPFALHFLQAIRSMSVKVWFIKTILQCHEKSFKESDQSIRAIFEKFVGSFETTNITQLLVKTIARVVGQCLQSNDLTFLETQISSGRSIMYGFDQQSTVYEVVKFYNRLFWKLPCQQEQIQSDIISLFRLLKRQNLNINASFRSFDQCLAKATNSQIIARHLCFAIEILDQIDSITQTVKGWLHRINQQSIQYYFDIFAEFFIALAEKIVETPGNLKAVDVLVEGVRIFRHSIYFYLCSQNNTKFIMTSNQVKIMRMLNHIKEYSFLNQKSVDADFLELFEDLRLKISSKMTSPLVVLSSIDFDLLMSERLMLFHILTLDTAEHEGLEVERPKSKLLDLIQREKYFNIGNLFNQIFSQLKEESGLDVVDLLSNALQADDTFTKLMIKQNGVMVVELLLKLDAIPFLRANKMLKILISLYSYSKDKMCESLKEKYIVVIRISQVKLGMWVQSASITQATFLRIFDFLSRALNGLKYEQHLPFLEAGRRYGYLLDLPLSRQKRLQTYGIYMLCMMASLKRDSIDPRDESELSKIRIDLTIFTDIAMVMIRFYSELAKREDFSQFATKYITKLFKVLHQCQKVPFLSFFIKQQFKRISGSIETYRSKFGSTPFLRSQMASIAQCLGHSLPQSSLEDKFEEIDVSKVHDQSKFNDAYIRNVRMIQNQVKLDKSPHLLTRLISFLEANKQRRLKLIGFNKEVLVRFLKHRQTSAIFLKVLQTIMNMMNYEFAMMKINTTLVEQVVKQLSINHTQSGSLQSIILNRMKLQTVIVALENSLVSIFFVRINFNLQVLQVLQGLRGYLSMWGQADGSLYPVLAGTIVHLQWYPTGLRNCFSLWNLLEFRQKLGFLRNLLRYCLQMNGLNQLKQYNLVEIIMDYLKLLKRNQDVMKGSQFAQNCKLVNDFISHKHNATSSPFKFVRKGVSYEQLRQICGEIGERLNKLDCDFTEESLQFFSDFNVQLTS